MIKNYTTRKGKHRAWPWRLGLYFRKKKISFRVVFDQSCKYDIGLPDQLDVNKLFGIAYFPGRHKESARFGWRYNNDTKRIEILAYCYLKGQREIHLITSLPLHLSHVMTLEITDTDYRFTVKMEYETTVVIQHNRRHKWGYPLGVFFGGNQTAPHDITIEMRKA